MSNKRNATFIFTLWLSLKVSKMRVGVDFALQFRAVKCEEPAVWVLRRCRSPCARDKQISHGTPDAYSQHVHAQQQTTDVWDVFTDSLAIKEDPCTVAAGPIFDTDTMPRLTPAECERAVGLLTAKEDPRAVAVAFNVHLATIYRLQQCFTATRVTDDRPWTGRPRVTTQRQDRHIFSHHIRDRFQTANETGRNNLGNHQRPISGQTVRRWLAERDWRTGVQLKYRSLLVDIVLHACSGPETTPTGTGGNGGPFCLLTRAATAWAMWTGVPECGGEEANIMLLTASCRTTPGEGQAWCFGAALASTNSWGQCSSAGMAWQHNAT